MPTYSRSNTVFKRLKTILPCLLLAITLFPGAASSLTFTLPDNGDSVVGALIESRSRYQDTFSDLARHHNLGFLEMSDANPGVDPWLPGEGTKITIPKQFVLPNAPRQGVVINLAELRLYYFPKDSQQVVTHPIGIGREGWATPTGRTRIHSKLKAPAWRPPESIKAEYRSKGTPLPDRVPPGPKNPLGGYALYFDMPGYLIHGTNKPYGVGMRVSHGCIRLYPEDIQTLFNQLPVGTPVRIVNQPYKAGLRAGTLYIEAHTPLSEQKAAQGQNLTPLVKAVLKVTNSDNRPIDWQAVKTIALEHKGVPTAIPPLER